MKTLLNDYDAILARIEQLNAEKTPLWGEMNVNEMLVHLTKPLVGSLGKGNARDVSTFFTRNITKYLILYIRRELPKGVRGPREVDMRRNPGLLQGFDADKANLLRALATFRADTRANTGAVHPYFGKFNRNEWSRFHYLHIDHHLRQFGV